MAAKQPNAVNSLFTERFNASDLEGLIALYEPDAIFVPQPGKLAVGIGAIREAYIAYFATKARINLENVYCIETGDVAMIGAKWHINAQDPDGNSVEMEGVTSELLRRQTTGDWLFVIDNPFSSSPIDLRIQGYTQERQTQARTSTRTKNQQHRLQGFQNFLDKLMRS